MLLHGHKYLDTVHALLKEARQANLAVAFWGQGSEMVFRQWRGTSLRIVCNLALGGTNPDVVPKLRALPGVEVRQLDNLHAKLVLTEREMVVGSANMSSNGLGLEASEIGGFKELGLRTATPELLAQGLAWFEQIWASAKPIGESDLRRARSAWSKRRSVRPMLATRSVGLLELPPEVIEDRKIYVAVYRSGLSRHAEDRLKKENAKLASQKIYEHSKLDVYEGWEEDDLPKDPSSIIIPVYWGVRGKVEVCALQRPVPELEDSYREGDEEWRLDFTAIIKDSVSLDVPFVFSSADRKALTGPISRWLASMRDQFDDGEEGSFCVPAHQFLSWYSLEGGR